MKKLIVGISGASGTIYGIRLLETLQGIAKVETHVVVTGAARRTLALETDYHPDIFATLADTLYKASDVAAAISSGSFKTAGMVVVPCSMVEMHESHAPFQFCRPNRDVLAISHHREQVMQFRLGACFGTEFGDHGFNQGRIHRVPRL